MRLRGIEFGHVFNAAGARNFFGDGYSFHDLFRPFGLNYADSTFVSKTTTLHARPGNMPLAHNSTRPLEFAPRCIYVNPRKRVVVNAVGLSGPGIPRLIANERWQKWERPFFVSITSMAPSTFQRRDEFRAIVALLQKTRLRDGFRAPFGLQINVSCPNGEHTPKELAAEAATALDVCADLKVPLAVKLSPLTSIASAKEISEHPSCNALVFCNSLPWGALPAEVNWPALFGSDVSPLIKRGVGQSGGLSGSPLLPIVVGWIRNARLAGITKPIVGGGGILCANDAEEVLKSGANAVELGCVSLLRPWRVRGIITHVNQRMASRT